MKSPSEEIKDVLPRYSQEVTEVVDAVTWYDVVDGYRYDGSRQKAADVRYKQSSSCPVTYWHWIVGDRQIGNGVANIWLLRTFGVRRY